MPSLGISATNALWLVLALIFVWMLYRFQKKNANFDIADAFMNHSISPPKADLTSMLIFVMALMFIWVCVKRTIADKDVDNLVLGGLSIFVLRQAFKIGADAYSAKPSAPDPEPAQPPTINVNTAAPGAPQNPLTAKPVKVEVANPEPIEVTQTPAGKPKAPFNPLTKKPKDK